MDPTPTPLSRRPHTGRVTTDRGASISTALTLLFPVLLLAGGLAVDGAVQARAASWAHAVASTASRSGCEAASGRHLAGDPVGPEAGRAEALRTASELLDAQGRATVNRTGPRLVVEVTVSRPTVVLGVVGLRRVRGTASASCALSPR